MSHGLLELKLHMKPMHLDRRKLLLAGASSPFLASCASDMTKLGEKPPEALAADLKVCSAAYVALQAGTPGSPVVLSGCSDPKAEAGAIFQAASLTKPVVAFAALRLALAGQLDLNARVSQYLPDGYRHFHSPLRRGPSDPHDLVPASSLTRVSAAQLLNHSAGFPNWTGGSLAVEAEPGKRWSYSGEGFVLLQQRDRVHHRDGTGRVCRSTGVSAARHA